MCIGRRPGKEGREGGPWERCPILSRSLHRCRSGRLSRLAVSGSVVVFTLGADSRIASDFARRSIRGWGPAIMTYCLGIATKEGFVVASDARSNAGYDQVNICRKMHRFEDAGERV